MREVNAAWAVLRDPRRRSAYDQSLAPHEAAPPLVLPRDDLATPEPLLAEAPSGARGALWWAGPVIALVVLVGVAVVVAIVQPREARPGVEVQAGSTYEPGMCVAVRPGPFAEIVPCSGPSSGRIVEVQPYPKPCSDGSLRAVALPTEQTQLCLEPAG
jgi:hypothetical protein